MDVNYRGSIKFTINKTNRTQNFTAKLKAKKSDEQCQMIFVIHVCKSLLCICFTGYNATCLGKKAVQKIIELLTYS